MGYGSTKELGTGIENINLKYTSFELLPVSKVVREICKYKETMRAGM